jgi:glutaredoxin
MDLDTTATPSAARITVVESDGCHFCVDAQRSLAELSETFPLRVVTLDLDTDAGQRLMTWHRAALSPLVLLDGSFFSQGRLPRRKLERELGRRSAQRAAGV